MSNNPGLLAVTLYKPSDGTAYQLDGKDIAPDSPGYNNSGNFVGQTRGGERQKNRTVTFEVRHADATFNSNLTGDTDFENRSWRMVAAEMDGFVLWYETVRVVVPETKAEIDPESDDPYPYSFRLRFVGASPAISRGTNLLYAYAKTQGFASSWQDSDSDNEADGWEFDASFTSLSFSSGVQSADVTDSNKSILIDVVFPISSIAITFSFNIVAAHSEGNSVSIRDLSFADAELSSSSSTFTTSGLKSTELTTNSNVFSVELAYNTGASLTVNETIQIKDPNVRLNGSTTYIDG